MVKFDERIILSGLWKCPGDGTWLAVEASMPPAAARAVMEMNRRNRRRQIWIRN